MIVDYVRVREGALLPRYATEGSSGADLYSCEEAVIPPGEVRSVGTGIAMEIPEGMEGQIRPRSGIALRDYCFDMPNSPGTIDSDYRGEVKVLVKNVGEVDIHISYGSRIAQIVFMPVMRARFFEKESLCDTVRGANGFGSTGVKIHGK